jgi:hypothetical protein
MEADGFCSRPVQPLSMGESLVSFTIPAPALIRIFKIVSFCQGSASVPVALEWGLPLRQKSSLATAAKWV